MMIEIRRKLDNSLRARVQVNDSSIRRWELMGEDTVTLELEVGEPIDFKIGDWFIFQGKTFSLNTIPPLTKTGHRRYHYTAVFESSMYDLGKVQFLLFTDDPVNPAPIGTFDITGTAQTLTEQIVVNMNRDLGGWSISGDVPVTEHKNLFFEGETCLAALHRICEEFGMEFIITGKSITLGHDLGTSHNRTFRYGKGRGLYELRRVNIDSKEVITRLYAFGSERNIPADYRNHSPRLKLPTDYVESNVSEYGVIEHTEIFDDIYPTRKGTVSWISSEDHMIFRDTGMDFDLNDYLLAGLSAKVHFLTGDLAGYSIEVSSYTHLDNKFTLKVNRDEKDFEVPSETIKPEVGDEYVLLDILLPQSYIDAAEAKLVQRAQDFIDKYSTPQVSYELTIDPVYIKQNPLSLAPGDWVKVGDPEVSILENVRVLGVSYPIIHPEKLEVSLAEEPTPSVEELLYRERQKLAAINASANARAISLSLLYSEVSRLMILYDMFALSTDGSGKQYIQAKLDLMGEKGIAAYSSADVDVPSIFDDLPRATASSYGVVKVGYGIAVADGVISVDGDSFDLANYYTKENLQTSGQASIHWGNLNNTPGTLSGYGITDAYTQGEVDNLLDLKFDKTGGSISGDVSINGSLTITGLGQEFIADVETIRIADNLAIINYGETGAGITAGFAGWEADRGSLPSYRWGYDEPRGLWVLGKVDTTLQAVATREDSPTANGFAKWNDSLKRFDTETLYSTTEVDNALNLKVNKAGDTMTDLLQIYKDESGSSTIPLLLRNNSTSTGTSTILKLLNSTSSTSAAGAVELVNERTNNPTYSSIFIVRTNRGSSSTLSDAFKVDENGDLMVYGNILATGGITAYSTGSGDPVNFISGSGITSRLARFVGSSEIGNSAIADNGTNIAINATVNNDNKLYATQGRGNPTILGHNTYNSTDGLAAVGGTTDATGKGYLGAYINGKRAGVYGEAGDYDGDTLAGYFDGKVEVSENVKTISLKGISTDWELHMNNSQYVFLREGSSASTIRFYPSDGDVWSSGNITAVDFIQSSDERLKTNISPLNKYSDDVNYYSFNIKDSNRKRYGVIAQEIEDKYPELVIDGSDGFKKVSYIDLHSMEIAMLKDRIFELEKMVKNECA